MFRLQTSAMIVTAALLCAVAAMAADLSETREAWRRHMDAGNAAHAKGDRQTAEVEFRAALALGDREQPRGLASAASLNALAVLYMEDEKWDAAAPVLDEAIRIFSDLGHDQTEHFAKLLTTRGDLARAQNRQPEAERDYKRALKIAGLSKAAHDRALRALVGCICRQGRTEEATMLGRELRIVCRAGSDASAP